MLHFFITGINANIRFAQLEKKGNEYQRPLEELLALIPQHAALALDGVAGEPQLREELARKQAQIDKAFGELEAVDARLGAELKFTDQRLAKLKREHYRVRTVREEWQVLKTHWAQFQPEACAKQHLHLMADVRMMIIPSCRELQICGIKWDTSLAAFGSLIPRARRTTALAGIR